MKTTRVADPIVKFSHSYAQNLSNDHPNLTFMFEQTDEPNTGSLFSIKAGVEVQVASSGDSGGGQITADLDMTGHSILNVQTIKSSNTDQQLILGIPGLPGTFDTYSMLMSTLANGSQTLCIGGLELWNNGPIMSVSTGNSGLMISTAGQYTTAKIDLNTIDDSSTPALVIGRQGQIVGGMSVSNLAGTAPMISLFEPRPEFPNQFCMGSINNADLVHGDVLFFRNGNLKLAITQDAVEMYAPLSVKTLTTVERTTLTPGIRSFMVYDTDIGGMFYWDVNTQAWKQIATL